MEFEECDCVEIKEDEVYSDNGKLCLIGECTKCGQLYEGVINND